MSIMTVLLIMFNISLLVKYPRAFVVNRGMNDYIWQLRLGLFKKSDGDMYMGDSMAITDNFDDDGQLSDKHFDGVGRLAFPLKLSFIAVVICMKGEISATINRERVSLRRGDVLMAFNGSIIEGMVCEAGTKTVAMAVGDNIGQQFFNKADKEMRSRIKSWTGFVSFHVGDAELELFRSQYINTKQLYSLSVPAFREDVVQAFVMENAALFFSRLVNNIETRPSMNRETELYSLFISNLQRYACQHRTVDFYADKLCVSAKYLSRVIHQSSGRSPSQLIQERVALEAKSMLATSTMTVRQIADALNFSSDNQFCQYFKKQTGITPTDYRRTR